MVKKKSVAAKRLGTGEIELLQVLWRLKGATILETQQELGLPIGYTTVQTRLNRLVKKGVAAKSEIRPAKYSATITPKQIQKHDLDILVDHVSEGKVVPLVAHLVKRSEFTGEELTELRRLVADAERKSKSSHSANRKSPTQRKGKK